MSTSGIIAQNGKIFDNLLPNPYPYPAFPSPLGAVLIAGDDAGNGNIENLAILQTTNVVQQDTPGQQFLVIGGTITTPGVGGDLRIQGATTKGSLLVGDGTSTAEFAVPAPPPPNGSVLILDSTQPLGVRWGGESGPIATITAGNNIDIVGTSANPIIAFQSPTTSDIVLGTATKIVAKDNYATPNFTTEIDSTGFNDSYSLGGVVNQEDIAVSATNVIQTLSTTFPSDYINSAVLTCDTNLVNDVRSSQILTSGSEKTASATISCNTSGANPNAGFRCVVSTPTSPSFPDIEAEVNMGCSNTSTPFIYLSQSAPFATSYSTIINKDGINQSNSAGTGFSVQSAQDISLLPTQNLLITADNLNATASNLSMTSASAGGQANPLLTLTNTNATGSVALEVYKNKPTAGSNGDVLFNQSVYGKDSGNAKQEYTRIAHTIRDNIAGTEDGSIEMSCFVAGSVSTFLQLNGVENEVNCLKVLDMTGNNIRTTTGDMTITAFASTGTGDIDIQAKGDAQIGGGTGNTNVYNTNGNIQLTAGGVASDLELNCANWESGTAGAASVKFLRIKLNGVYHKIQLLDD
jgi:hypothetical protein